MLRLSVDRMSQRYWFASSAANPRSAVQGEVANSVWTGSRFALRFELRF